MGGTCRDLCSVLCGAETISLSGDFFFSCPQVCVRISFMPNKLFLCAAYVQDNIHTHTYTCIYMPCKTICQAKELHFFISPSAFFFVCFCKTGNNINFKCRWSGAAAVTFFALFDAVRTVTLCAASCAKSKMKIYIEHTIGRTR